MVTTIAELAKYIDICHHFVEERVVSNEIRVIYCCTEAGAHQMEPPSPLIS